MNRFSTWCGVFAVVLSACTSPSSDSQRAAVQTLTCSTGQVPFNFSKFTSPMTTEGISSLAPDERLPRSQRTPNVLRITSATCNARFDWTALLGEFCDGRESCVINRQDCPGVLQYAYTCSSAPNDVVRRECPGTFNCLGSLSCTQPAPVVNPLLPADKVACVPESCGISQRRDKDLNCVDAPERPVELSNFIDQRLPDSPWDDEYIENRAWVSEFTTPYPPLGVKNQNGNAIANFDYSGIWPWAPDGPTGSTAYPFFQRAASENNFAGRYRVMFAGAYYRMKGGYRFADTSNAPLQQKARKGSLTLYLVDDYGTQTQGADGRVSYSVSDSVVRCVLHEFDLGKYTPKAAADRADNFFIEFDEGVVVPRDCEEGGPIWSENVKVLAKKNNKTPLDFVNTTRLMTTRLLAAYDIAGRVTYVSQKKTEAATACSPKPLDMFYNSTLETHDRVAYYRQRSVPLSFSFTGNDASSNLPAGGFTYRLQNGGVHVRGATKTSVGITGVRPKRVEFKFKSANPSRQFFRADVDWFMSGDDRDFWKTQGLTGDIRAKMTLSLVPVDANMRPRLADELLLGPSPLLTSTPAGEMQTMRFEVTKEVKEKFLDKAGAYYATENGTAFLLRSCISLVKLSGPTETPVPKFEGKAQLAAFVATDFSLKIEPGRYGQEQLEVVDAQGCITGEMPIVVKLDPSLAPLAADEADEFSDSDPQAAGDARVSQTYDQDNDRRCTKAMVAGRNGEHCDSRTISGLGGSTAATILRTEVSNTDKGDTVVVDKEAELMGLQVFDEEETKNFEFMSNRANVTVTIAPNFDSIADAINAANTGSSFEAEEKRFSIGVSGLGLALSIKIPLRYGPVQGEIIFEISGGVGVGAEVSFKQERETHQKCADGTTNCDALYTVGTTPLPFRQARAACLAKNGGRLADLRTASESTRLRAKLTTPGQEYWIGAQVANEYMKNCADLARLRTPAAQAVFLQTCSSQHKTHLRWLSNDEDFATRTANGNFVADLTEIEPGTPSLTLRGETLELPKERGVALSSSGQVSTPEMTVALPYVCKSPDLNYAVKNEATLKVVLAAGAGMKLAFCTPSADMGACVEGSLNFIEATLEPSITYTHIGVGDSTGGSYVSRSNIKLALEFGLTALNGSVDAKIVFSVGIFDFELKYNILEFSGFKIPTGDPLEKEIPLTGAPQ
jgi:hypothetical protein